MFEIKNAQNYLLRPARAAPVTETQKYIGTEVSKKEKNISTSVTSMSIPGTPNGTVSDNAITIDLDPMMTGLSPQTEHQLHRVYLDMYYNDVICGSMADLNAMLPFSEFSLGNLTMQGGDKIREKFMENVERLNIRTLLPEISLDHQVLGAHVSSLLYNADTRTFVDIMPHRIENCNVEPLPFYSQEPIITVDFPPAVIELLSRTGSKRIDKMREMLGVAVVEKMKSGRLELDPLSTIYLPRRTFSRNDRGTSLFRRVLPLYLVEKNLYRGMLVESARRQRAILHITVGDGDQWIPTIPDMEFVTDLFNKADSDPIGAIITTRMGIATEEIRAPGDIWKSTDFADSVTSMKLRALLASESLLTGDQSLATSDNGLVVYLDYLRNYRENMTRKFLYNKLFPLISLVNGYTVNKGRLRIRENLINEVDSEEALCVLNDGSKLLIPQVLWHKHLKPEGDSSYVDLLDSLTQKGVPVPLRAMAAAGGLELESLLRDQEEDLAIRKKVSDYMKKITDLAPKAAEGDAESAAQVLSAVETVLASEAPTGSTRSAVLAAADKSGKRPNLMTRDFSHIEPIKHSKTGKPKVVHNRPAYEARANDNIIKAMREINRRLK